jgi:hypothetical protein
MIKIWLLLVGITLSASAVAEEPLLQRFMRGVEAVDLLISFNENTEDSRACNLDTNLIRTTLVNRLVPAGLPIDGRASVVFGTNIATIRVRDELCVSSLSFHILYFTLFIRNGSQESGYIVLDSYVEALSSARSRHRTRMKEAIEDRADVLIAAWREANPQQARRQPSAVPSSGPAMTETRVRDIQRKLHELGYYPGNPDGQMGPSTRAAIGKFQRASGLPVTNNPDWTTLEKLFE